MSSALKKLSNNDDKIEESLCTKCKLKDLSMVCIDGI